MPEAKELIFAIVFSLKGIEEVGVEKHYFQGRSTVKEKLMLPHPLQLYLPALDRRSLRSVGSRRSLSGRRFRCELNVQPNSR
jgi:hypothetical protein